MADGGSEKGYFPADDTDGGVRWENQNYEFSNICDGMSVVI